MNKKLTMKTFTLNLFSLLFFFSYHLLIAQIKMGDRPLEIHPQAIFEIESTDQGVLLPRMSTEERDLVFKTDIPNGLLIFNLTPITLSFMIPCKILGVPSKQIYLN